MINHVGRDPYSASWTGVNGGGAGIDDYSEKSLCKPKRAACTVRYYEGVAEVLRIFNGDWTKSRLQHVCIGDCCGSREQSIARAAKALRTVIFGRMPSVPQAEPPYEFVVQRLQLFSAVYFEPLFCMNLAR